MWLIRLILPFGLQVQVVEQRTHLLEPAKTIVEIEFSYDGREYQHDKYRIPAGRRS